MLYVASTPGTRQVWDLSLTFDGDVNFGRASDQGGGPGPGGGQSQGQGPGPAAAVRGVPKPPSKLTKDDVRKAAQVFINYYSAQVPAV